MLKYRIPILLSLALVLFSCNNTDSEPNISEVLWYDKPAQNWTEALPIGNGRLGAMLYGGVESEIIQFNEETLWTGQPHDYAHLGAHEVLAELRQLLWEGKQDEAHELANERFMSQPLRQLSYQPFGNVLLEFPNQKKTIAYKRELNLENAISSVFHETENAKFKREIFASSPDQAIVIRLEADKKGALNFTASLNSPHSKYQVSVIDNEVILQGKANNYSSKRNKDKNLYPDSKLRFEARLKVLNEEGELINKGNSLQIKNAKAVTLILVGATNFVDYNDISANPEERCKNALKKINGKTYKELKNSHIADYQKLYKRVKLELGSSEISYRPTNERLKSFKQDKDPSLVSLLFQYGRYLLVSSSRLGTQPANLQGIWNDRLDPPWDSKYTININTEMNYWLAEMTNLSELTDPLINMVEDLSETGKTVAKEHYNKNGWVAHHNTDIWRGTAPINSASHGIWVTGGAWLCQHLWWHYQFTGNKDYLKNRAYPILKEASMFFSEYLVSDPKNPEQLVSGPSNSPENGGLVMGPTMDHQIIRNLFSNTIEAAEILNIDADFVDLLKDKKARIAPNKIGKYGQLQEWLEDLDDPENKHRHISHLWGLHPGNEIHPLTTPDLATACRVTLSQRGDGGTGWSRAWKINFWARLLDGDHAFSLLQNLMVPSTANDSKKEDSGGLYLNLLDACPPFQIDGNFGATSGITEMLLQSHLRNGNGDYYQDILPALPSALSSGKVTGIKGRGGFEFSIEWKNNKLVKVVVKSLLGNNLNLRYAGKLITEKTSIDKTYTYNF